MAKKRADAPPEPTPARPGSPFDALLPVVRENMAEILTYELVAKGYTPESLMAKIREVRG